MSIQKYTNDELKNAVASSRSFRQVFIKLNISPQGGNYRSIKNKIKKLNLNTDHFLGQKWNVGRSPNIYLNRTTEDYLNNKFKISSHKLRIRLLNEGYFDHKCYHCHNTIWNNQPIPLELEHKDGNHDNNNIDNLTLLCPNCHAQTKTYRGRNIKSKPKPSKKQKKQPDRKVERPPLEILEKEVLENGYCATGRKYGVSDNCIRKWIKNYK